MYTAAPRQRDAPVQAHATINAHARTDERLLCPAHPPLDCSLAEAAERLALDLLEGLSSQVGWTPLFTASLGGHSAVVDRLIAARAMVDAADEVMSRTRPRHHHARTTHAARC
jgi:hypothetical protein